MFIIFIPDESVIIMTLRPIQHCIIMRYMITETENIKLESPIELEPCIQTITEYKIIKVINTRRKIITKNKTKYEKVNNIQHIFTKLIKKDKTNKNK